ncbi:Type IV secretory pathway, VirB6 component [Anopheles sinensis]|uniref:Type IV secretory pathway, VirB6 component n=1 Tax=Anopheles sinensis TaxID=74873 RepID=A0A084VYI3_ANOSI|nr:Type IV secretory pathway, VirB6 component [Anopheles sinensis]
MNSPTQKQTRFHALAGSGAVPIFPGWVGAFWGRLGRSSLGDANRWQTGHGNELLTPITSDTRLSVPAFAEVLLMSERAIKRRNRWEAGGVRTEDDGPCREFRHPRHPVPPPVGGGLGGLVWSE